MALTDSDLRDLAQLFLAKRLGEHSETLDRCQQQVEREILERSLSSGPLARGLLVGAWVDALEKHCDQVLDDLFGLMRSFAAFSSAQQIREQFDGHVKAATDNLFQSLAESDFGGVSSVAAEQNRVANVIAGINRRISQRWQTQVDREARQRLQTGSLLSAAEDIDDRLPLNRRRAFDRDLAEMAKAATEDSPLSLVMIDIDHFKKVNDNHGHPVGDEVLIEVADLVVRRAANKGKAYRFGGEEFALLLPAYSAEEAVGLGERIRKDIAGATLSSKKLEITASFGVACLPDDAADSKKLLESSDVALYKAKHQGRNQVRAAEGLGKPQDLG